jgi:hypothetical protein
MLIVPLSGVSNPASRFSNDVFPAPEYPITAVLRLPIASDTSFSLGRPFP